MKFVLKLVGGLVAAVVIAVVGLGVALVVTAARPARAVGIQQVLAPDPGRAPVPVTIFYPTDGKPKLVWTGLSFAWLAPKAPVTAGAHPLVVISHGTGGAQSSHLDTALALAEAGYVVAAPVHPGDNFQDDSAVGTGDWIVSRARHLVRVNDYMLTAWKDRARLDDRKVGVFGLSAGGTAALVAAGGEPDFSKVASHCQTRPEFVCTLMKPGLRVPSAAEWPHDNRIRAAVIASPGFGFTLEPNGLSGVRAPVQLWAGAADDIVPVASNTDVVRRRLPAQPEFHLVPNAGHVAFVAPCGLAAPLLPKRVCGDPKGFNRSAFHKEFNRSVVAFFDRSLSTPAAAD